MNMLRQIVLAVALMVLGAQAARAACPGQTGKSIFADDFSDDSGGWDVDASETYTPGALQIKTSAKVKGTGALNQTFNAVNADYCVVTAFSPDPPEADNSDYVALVLLATDYQNRFQLSVYSDGTAAITKAVSGTFTTLLPATKIAAINTKPGAENTLRVVVKDQKLAFFVNGAPIKTLRAQTPDAANKFGLFAGAANPITKERVYAVKSFSVTEAP